MSDPLVYEVEGAAYVSRQARLRRLLEQFNRREIVGVAEWIARMTEIHAEVPPLPLIPGATYRVILFAGSPGTDHRHYRDVDTGVVLGLDVPAVRDVEAVEITGRFVRRLLPAFPPASGVLGSIVLGVDGRLAVFADVDVLRLEEVR